MLFLVKTNILCSSNLIGSVCMYIESTWPRLTSLVAKYFFPDLIAKYNSSLISDRNNEKVLCQKILDKMELHGYQVKKTMFMIVYVICLYLCHMPTFFSFLLI